MKKIVLVATLLFVNFTFVYSQESEKEKNKQEVHTGFTYSHFLDDRGYTEGRSLNGFNGSYKRNINSYLGVKGQFSGSYKRRRFIDTNSVSSTNDTSVYTYMGGIEVKNNSKSNKMKPFAHLLVGGAKIREKHSLGGGTDNNGFAWAVGAGIDKRVNKKMSFRLVQLDYNPVSVGRKDMKRVKVGFGIVFH